jgi:hypothetical protein|uniref:Uncharacterized protein n=1 Tax=Picea glauca TaxID=3330 RepID=A0A101M340_PICGL|nr:hypothetical protein ABT39_MTgene22 [Picea glauca]QHR86210.1 hypothetical protein Q903MT_gene209 [Picea sitchensis]
MSIFSSHEGTGRVCLSSPHMGCLVSNRKGTGMSNLNLPSGYMLKPCWNCNSIKTMGSNRMGTGLSLGTFDGYNRTVRIRVCLT